MKSIKLIITLCLISITFVVNAAVYTIGNDTIYKIDGKYYYVNIGDSTLADTSIISVHYYNNINPSSIDSIEQLYFLTEVQKLSDSSFQYSVAYGTDYITSCNNLVAEPLVKSIGRHFYMELAAGFEPNDEDIDEQWYLEKLQIYDPNGTSNDIAWNLTKGNPDIVVAVIDAGLDWELDEFGPNDFNIDVVSNNADDIWTTWYNPNSGNNLDDDDNGFIDDYKGWDFNNSGNDDIQDNDVRPNYNSLWHGNAISGIIAAKSNNESDIAGMGGGDAENGIEGIKIMPLKVLDYYYDNISGQYIQNLPTYSVEQAIYYAANNGANVINLSIKCSLSWHGVVLTEAVNYALEEGIVLIGASGNENYNNHISYPASEEGIIAVGGTDEDDMRWVENSSFGSNYGEGLEFVAPADDILVLDNNSTTISNGTSFSTAMTSATVAMMFSVNPYLSNSDINTEGSVRYILKETADKVNDVYYNYDPVNGWSNQMGYGRINTYQAICKALEYRPDEYVSNDETWVNDVIFRNNIIVESGTHLTISCKVMMGPEAKIIVEQGAILTIDGGHITNLPYCNCSDQLWGGIEVWGDPERTQESYAGHPSTQGQLFIENSLIENALVAVRLFSEDHPYTTTGGIIDAEQSTFKNNIKTAVFNPYKNILEVGGVIYGEYDYYGNFINCSFLIDEEFLADETYKDYRMFELNGVNGIKLYGCYFENSLDNFPSGNAIKSLDAGFNIKGHCDNGLVPCQEYNRTLFKGYYCAIDAGNSASSLYTVNITETDFEHNGYGIKLYGNRDAIIVGNNFELGEHNECTDDGAYGIYLDNSNRFAIEDNSFYLHDPVYAVHNTGIRVINTGSHHDEIYNNSFDGMEFAIYTDYKNFYPINKWGLAFYCNSNQNNYVDFYVSEKGIPGNKGIQKLQGDVDFAAGNTFSPSAIGHFYNYADYEIEYYYTNSVLSQTPTNIYQVKPIPINVSNNCTSHYNGNNTRLSSAEYQQTVSTFNSASSLYSTYKSSYDSIGQNGDSATLSLLENLMAFNYREMARAAYDIIRSDLNDTIVKQDEFVLWMNKIKSFTNDQSLTDYYLQIGDTTNAMLMIDSLWSNYSHSSGDSLELDYFSQLKTTQSKIINAGRNISELTTLEINKIEIIANNSHGLAGAQARSILSYADAHYTFTPDCTDDPDEIIKSQRANNDEGDISSVNKFIRIYPNPTSDFANVEYKLPDGIINGQLNIYDELGKKVISYDLNNSIGSFVIKTETLEPGIYIYKFASGNVKETGRLIIL